MNELPDEDPGHLTDWNELREVRRADRPGLPFNFRGATWIPEKYVLVDTETGDVWGYYVQDMNSLDARTRRLEDRELLWAAVSKLMERIAPGMTQTIKELVEKQGD